MPGLLCYRGKRKGKERKGTPVLRAYPHDILHARLFPLPLLLHRVPPGQNVAECSGRRALVPSYALTCPPAGRVGLSAKSLLRLSLFLFFFLGWGGGYATPAGPKGSLCDPALAGKKDSGNDGVWSPAPDAIRRVVWACACLWPTPYKIAPGQIDRVARRGERWHREQAMSEGIQEREKVPRLGFD
jgi:hypothetical protein